LEPDDVETLFHLLDSAKDGIVTYKDLVQGVSRLKGAARSIDMINFQRQFKNLEKKLDKKIGNPQALS